MGRPRFSSPLTAVFVVAHEGRHPMNLLPPPMDAEVILEAKGLSRGRCPVSRFPWMLKRVKLLRFSTHNGNSPDSRLFARNNRVRLGRFPSSDGIDPLRLLLLRCSRERLDRFPSSDGIDPLRLLLLRCSCERLDRFPSSDGIDPVRLLPWRCSCVRLARLPSSGGIDPVRLLPLMARYVRLARLPSSGGSVPFSESMPGEGVEILITMTRRCGFPPILPVVIPCQLDIAVDASHPERVAVPRRVSFSPQRTLQSAMSSVSV